MPARRRVKQDHLIHADVVDSRSKSGVWFGEQEEFKSHQKRIMDRVRDKVNWVGLEGAIMAISSEPAGIVVVAPNPSLPGIIVLADGTTQKNTEKLQARLTSLLQDVVQEVGIPEEAARVRAYKGATKPRASRKAKVAPKK